MKHYIVLFITAFSFQISCVASGGNEEHFRRDTVPKERLVLYHQDTANQRDRQQLFLHNMGRTMGLPNLSTVKIDMCVRIWIWDFDKKYMINIVDSNSNELCSVVKFDGKKLDGKDYMVIQKEWNNLVPKWGWDSLLKSIKKHNILNTRGGKDAKEYQQKLTGMAYIQFEILQDHQYRFYEYLEPSFYRYIDPDAMNVYQFLKELNKVLGIKIYSPADKLYVKPN